MIEAEFLHCGGVPFAIRHCEKFNTRPVTGHYNEVEQVWQGLEGNTLKLTLTATSGDRDQDAI